MAGDMRFVDLLESGVGCIDRGDIFVIKVDGFRDLEHLFTIMIQSPSEMIFRIDTNNLRNALSALCGAFDGGKGRVGLGLDASIERIFLDLVECVGSRGVVIVEVGHVDAGASYRVIAIEHERSSEKEGPDLCALLKGASEFFGIRSSLL